MRYFLHFTKFNILTIYYDELIETINQYYGKILDNIKISDDEFVLIVKDEFNKENIKEYLEGFFVENFINGKVYCSENFKNNVDFKDEIETIGNLLKEVSGYSKKIFYGKRDLALEYIKKPYDKVVGTILFSNVFDNQELKRTIQVFFDCNLNIVLAAKSLNVHRNTLYYRLNKFTKETGFDPRDFNDAFVIKHYM